MNNTQDSEQPAIPPLPPATGSAARSNWQMGDGSWVRLLTVAELRALPPETVVMDIMGNKRLVDEPGERPPDDDTRGGYSAWSVVPPNEKVRHGPTD